MTSEIQDFVVQEHIAPGGVHWDLMLRSGEILLTYRLDGPPEESLRQALNAERIHDHPLKFLTYQGPVNQGRGRVKLTESGTYSTGHQSDSQIDLSLNGQILQGDFQLIHVRDSHWLFRKIEDA